VGVNVNSTYTVGSATSPTSSYAFNITNQNSKKVDLDIAYSAVDTSAGSNVQFNVYDSGGSSIATADPASSTGIIPLDPGNTLYVVIEVTGGTDSTDDLSGTLTISA
jgi:hypothetical protein